MKTKNEQGEELDIPDAGYFNCEMIPSDGFKIQRIVGNDDSTRSVELIFLERGNFNGSVLLSKADAATLAELLVWWGKS